MAHFAKLDENNNVLAVHVVNNDVINVNGVEVEQAGIDFLTRLHGHTLWKQTSYNKTMRKNYAGIGYFYDPVADVFIAPQPYPSWSLDENFDWQAPTPRPIDGFWYWDESTLSWIEIES
ncbi:hypothetical protein EB001_23500 [bacterium]|nr:hypothetical protein [bacterium]